MQGHVLWFDPARGYGFLKGEDCLEYFFHWSSLNVGGVYKTIYNGTPVSYDIAPPEKASQYERPEAINVTPLQRIGKDGKPVILVCYLPVRPNTDINVLNMAVCSKSNDGIRFTTVFNDLVIGSETYIEENYIEPLYNFLKTAPYETHRILETNGLLPFDIILV